MVHCSVSLCACGQVHSMVSDWLLVYEWRYFRINMRDNLVLLQYCCRDCIKLQPVSFLSTSWTLAGTLTAVSVIILSLLYI